MAKRRGKKTNATGRSEGGDHYFALTYNMAKSIAFRSLSGAALKVFLELRCRFTGANNGKIIIPLRQTSQRLHLGQATVKRALDELVEKGFIQRTRAGRYNGRIASEWAVTDRPLHGMPPANSWRLWPRQTLPQPAASSQVQQPCTAGDGLGQVTQ